jgi:hypothetical protein
VIEVRVRVVAWLLLAATIVLIVADIVVTAQYQPLMSEASIAIHGFPFVEAAVVGSSLMGAVIISRYERHLIGWLLAVIGIVSAISLLAEAYGFWVVDQGGPGSRALGGVSSWLSQVLGGQLSVGLLALMFLLAPDGHLLSRRWRYAAWAITLGVAACFEGLLTLDPRTFAITREEGGIPLLADLLLTGGFLVIMAGVIASLVCLVRRFRRSQGEQRQQLRLIAAAAALLTIGLLNLFVVQILNGGHQTYAAALPLFISYSLVPLLFAVAVLRYRLYDVQVIINRTVLFAVGTAFAAIFYTLLVVVVGRLVGSQTSGFWLSLLATAVVAVAFQPVRRHAVLLANRLAFGARAKPYEALADFSDRLGATPARATLLPGVAEAAGRAVSARGSRVVLETPGGGAPASTGVWGDVGRDDTEAHVVPVSYGGARLGRIEVALPKGRDLRQSDARLLGAMADQAAVAFHNVAMESQLAAHVAELDRTTRALEQSRRRIIEADDAARRALESAISRVVMPHLVGIPEETRRLSAVVGSGSPDDGIDALVARTHSALEALREVSRGVFPTQLARAGIEPALRSHLARNGRGATTLDVDASASGRRFSSRVEAAVYFCCVEAAAALADRWSIRLSVTGPTLVLRVDGVEFEENDLQGIVDRVEAVQGVLETDGEVLVVRIPVGEEPPASSVDGTRLGSVGPQH